MKMQKRKGPAEQQLFGEIFVWIKGWISERASEADCRAAQMAGNGEHIYTAQRGKRSSQKQGSDKDREFWMQQGTAKSWETPAGANLDVN